MDETRIGDVTTVEIKRSREGPVKMSWFFAGCMLPLEVHWRRVISNQKPFFQPSMTEFLGNTWTVDLEMTQINGRGAF
jgi:hypothetical protein